MSYVEDYTTVPPGWHLKFHVSEMVRERKYIKVYRSLHFEMIKLRLENLAICTEPHN